MIALQQRRRQRLQVERQRRALQLVEHHVDEREDQLAQLVVRRATASACTSVHQRQQHVERVVVAGEEDLFLVAEVVVEIPLRHLERRGDFVDARAVIAAAAERRGRALENLDAAIGAVGGFGHTSCVLYHDLNARLNWCRLAAWSRLSSRKRPPCHFETSPDQYKHWKLTFDGAGRDAGDGRQGRRAACGPHDYKLKLNSYDLGVDIELADALQRIRFEHPEVHAVVVSSLKPRIFCAGANIFMLGTSSHGFKVNFCKFTNETRLGMEDMSANSGVKFLAALNGICAGGGYELALACDEIYLVDDGTASVALPETPLLGVLPGTGGLTRVVDKRKVRRDLADAFSTLTEGVRGKRAVEWRLVDKVVADQPVQGRGRRSARRSWRPQSDRPASGPGHHARAAQSDDRRRHDSLPLRARHDRSRQAGRAS